MVRDRRSGTWSNGVQILVERRSTQGGEGTEIIDDVRVPKTPLVHLERVGEPLDKAV